MFRALVVVTLLAIEITTTQRFALAMPPFAQSYGFDCRQCHIEVPALNAYGRFIQRSMYAELSRDVLKRSSPFWIGESVLADTQDQNLPHRVQFGNLAIHGVGFISKDLTYHIQQWLLQNDRPGGLDTAWISYDRIFGEQTHLSIGKQPPPGPSFFSQWPDFAPFAVPSITVGEHTQGLQTNRWGAKLGYAGKWTTADLGWFGSAADLNGATDFSRSIDKTFQWHAALAPSERPYQVGVYGNTGSSPLSNGGVDRYSATAGYVQIDPGRRHPGTLLLYQRGWDGNPGAGAGPARSTGISAGLFIHPLRRTESLLGVRRELTNDGLGTFRRSTNVDFSARIARYLHGTVEAAMQNGNRPAWRYYIWWTVPLTRAPSPAPSSTPPAPSPIRRQH